MDEHEFPAILLKGDDFIEVHIYGAISRQSIERIVAVDPENEIRRARMQPSGFAGGTTGGNLDALVAMRPPDGENPSMT